VKAADSGVGARQRAEASAIAKKAKAVHFGRTIQLPPFMTSPPSRQPLGGPNLGARQSL